MKRFLLILLLLASSCGLRSPIVPAPPQGPTPVVARPFIPLSVDRNASIIKAHPEYPLVADPQRPAWVVFAWLMGVIFVICFPVYFKPIKSKGLSAWAFAKSKLGRKDEPTTTEPPSDISLGKLFASTKRLTKED